MVQEGQTAPDFSLLDQTGETVQLSALRGKHVVLYFYPKDDTPGCTKEACGFRDLHAEFEAAGAVILGVSPDSVKSHDKFRTKYDLPFRLLSDAEKEVVQLYGVWKEKSMYGRKYMGVERTTFVIDREGKVRKIFPKVKVTQHPEAVLATVKEL
ncbi:MAG: thioredoxin-dependent thiol peroxidase [Calditrichaeota bacterium]|nr:MAG: thioredoxin-dependent thiol peroxidase [Calditrichota bacterium]